jgi:catechol 2,3-dioxygenase-like lactoylglutathione lyase family enzyme
MVAIKGVAHFSIPVSDVARSTRFYTEVVGCRHLSTTPNGQMVFLDAAGLCLILVKRNPPINTVPDNHGGVHHAFAVAHDEYAAALEHLRAHGVEITLRGGPARRRTQRPSRVFSRSRRHGVGVYRPDERATRRPTSPSATER